MEAVWQFKKQNHPTAIEAEILGIHWEHGKEGASYHDLGKR